ncbi:unnamed protein product [Pleuronectes platessa]|uniref:Uncharacterized protein n=1 Tax=Pleuronectes platessa TaxID=8262 RepID=A0A9N7TSJ9_PLEPL|nr:unnamed protein product [Pleuronectes platessa]
MGSVLVQVVPVLGQVALVLVVLALALEELVMGPVELGYDANAKARKYGMLSGALGGTGAGGVRPGGAGTGYGPGGVGPGGAGTGYGPGGVGQGGIGPGVVLVLVTDQVE